MKVLSLFSGIGAFEKALNRLNIDYELVNYCEIDKYASKSYSVIHNVSEELNLGDITKVDTSKLPKNIDLVTYGFPCQDISLAGKQKGFEDNGERTRSGLFFEALRIIEDTKPKVAIAENVKNLVSKKFKNEFEIVLSSLEEEGYNNYWQVLNAKDYGIPQNRERVFIVSIRKDVDDGSFTFSKPFELTLRLKDMLEDEVDEKYFLSNSLVEKIKYKFEEENTLLGGMQKNQSIKKDGICTTLTSFMGTGGGYVPMLSVANKEKGSSYTRNFGSRGKLQDIEENCQTLVSAMGTGGGNVPIIKVKINKRSEEKNNELIEQVKNGKYEPNTAYGKYLFQSSRFEDKPMKEISTTIKSTKVDSGLIYQLRIRKLTPKECWRLMGFDDEDFEKASKVNSNTQLYKQAGNSIVVDVLVPLLANLFGV